MADTYTLTVVRLDGTSHNTTACGYYAEGLLDVQFNEVIDDKRTLFAVVTDGQGVRRRYMATKETGNG